MTNDHDRAVVPYVFVFVQYKGPVAYMAHDVSLNGVLRRYFSVKVYSTCGVEMDDPDPREDPKSRSLNGGSYKVPVVV